MGTGGPLSSESSKWTETCLPKTLTPPFEHVGKASQLSTTSMSFPTSLRRRRGLASGNNNFDGLKAGHKQLPSTLFLLSTEPRKESESSLLALAY
jgi:hypothetical protein